MAVQGYTEADLRRLRSVHARAQGWSHQIRPVVREYRDEQTGHWIKVVKDGHGNRLRMRWEGQDAHVVLPHINVDRWAGVTISKEYR